jgi:hypothetical protein
MIIKASGRSALILATGLFVCFAGPSQAAGATDPAASATAWAPSALNKYAKHTAHHAKKLAQRKSSNVASKSSTDTKAAATDAADNSSTIQPSEIPPAVANANAQLASADAPNDTARAMAARASSIVQAAPDAAANPPPAANAAQDNTHDNTQVVSADQLNDVDRSLHESAAAAPPVATASADAPAPAATTATSNESSTWDQTSLIGKIFIGFGALLTMASAARMFMA